MPPGVCGLQVLHSHAEDGRHVCSARTEWSRRCRELGPVTVKSQQECDGEWAKTEKAVVTGAVEDSS